jgi:hypothetical protein
MPQSDTLEETVGRLLLQYAQCPPLPLPLPPALALRREMAIESLSLVAVLLRLGDELGVDVTEAGIDLGTVETVGDLVALARRIAPAGCRGDGISGRHTEVQP